MPKTKEPKKKEPKKKEPKQKTQFEHFTIKELHNIIDNFNANNIIRKYENGKPLTKPSLITEIKKHLTIENGMVKTLTQGEQQVSKTKTIMKEAKTSKQLEKQMDTLKIKFAGLKGKLKNIERQIDDRKTYEKHLQEEDNDEQIEKLEDQQKQIKFEISEVSSKLKELDAKKNVDKMNIDKIIDGIEKYHYVGCGNKKCKFISSSNSKTDATEKMKEILEPDWEELVGTSIYLVTVKKSVENGEWDEKKNFLLSGPIYIEIKKYFIEKNGKIKKSLSSKGGQFFFSLKYLEKNKKINKDDILESVFKLEKGKAKEGLMSADVL